MAVSNASITPAGAVGRYVPSKHSMQTERSTTIPPLGYVRNQSEIAAHLEQVIHWVGLVHHHVLDSANHHAARVLAVTGQTCSKQCTCKPSAWHSS
jgi:hypothetical protein